MEGQNVTAPALLLVFHNVSEVHSDGKIDLYKTFQPSLNLGLKYNGLLLFFTCNSTFWTV
jgi:hypothetical protein